MAVLPAIQALLLLPSSLRLGPLRLPLSGLCLAAGLMLALALSQPAARRTRLPPAAVWDALLAIAFAALLLSRLLLIAGTWRGFLAAPLTLLALPAINDTGLLLTGLFAVLWLRAKHLPLLAFLDTNASGAALLWAAATLGSLLDGTRNGLPGNPTPRPVEALTLLVACALAALSFRLLGRSEPAGRLSGTTLALAGLALYAVDFLRLPSAAPTAILDPVQWLGLAMAVTGGALVLALPARAETERPMPSKNMLPKGQRHHTVRPEYRASRGVDPTPPPPVPVLDLDDQDDSQLEDGVRTFTADPAAAGLRLDQYLAQAIPDISRARVQLLIDAGQVRVNGTVAKPKQKLAGGEVLEIEGEPRPEPLHATPEDIPLDILYEDAWLAVVNKPAGMMVHAGAGSTDDERNKGTLVNALLFHLAKLSEVGGDLRPGIVHRLDKQTSGAIVVAKDDSTHRKLGTLFSERQVHKTYIALVHGHIVKDLTTVSLPIARDLVRRTRMTTRRPDGRSAVSHIQVVERLSTPLGPFTLAEVRIETGRTHQIRVHLQSMGYPVVGDTLYGAPRVLRGLNPADGAELELPRNFLHAARLTFTHPQTGKSLELTAPLAEELQQFLATLRSGKPLSVKLSRIAG